MHRILEQCCQLGAIWHVGGPNGMYYDQSSRRSLSQSRTNTANAADIRGTHQLGTVKEELLVLSNLDERSVGDAPESPT